MLHAVQLVRVGVAMLAALGVPVERVRDLVNAFHEEQRANQLDGWEPTIGPPSVVRETLAYLGLRWELKLTLPPALSSEFSRFAEGFRRAREAADQRVRCKACGVEQPRPAMEGYGVTDGAGCCASCGCSTLLRVH